MKLANKLLLAFAAQTTLTVAVLLALWQAGLNRSFYAFIAQVESAPLIAAEERLVRFYQRDGSWDRLKADPNPWRTMGDRRPRGAGAPPPNERPGGTLRRVSVYDEQRRVVVGRADIEENPIVRELRIDGELIGYVGLVPERQLEGGPDRLLLQRQFLIGIASGSIVLVIALAVAWLMARHFTKPVQALSHAATRLRTGDLGWRAEIDTGDEIQTLAYDVNALAERLQSSEKYRREWTSNIAHELRTPVTILQSQCEAMLDGVVAADEERLERLVAETRRLERLIDDLYQLSLFESGRLSLEKSSLQLDELLDSRIRQYRERFEQAGLRLEFECDASTYPFIGDRDRLGQVFDNLLENSLRYTDAPGRLRISMRRGNSSYLVVFEDTEPGVPDEARDRLFDSLYRVDPSRNRKNGGSGLGLSLVRALLEAHGSHATCIESSLGGVGIQIQFTAEGNERV